MSHTVLRAVLKMWSLLWGALNIRGRLLCIMETPKGPTIRVSDHSDPNYHEFQLNLARGVNLAPNGKRQAPNPKTLNPKP